MLLPTVTNREQLYDALDQYALERRAEIDRRDLGADTGLIKSYVLELSRHEGKADVPAAFVGTGLRPHPLGDDGVFALLRDSQHLGYVEPLGSRYLAVHSQLQNTAQIDETIQRLVRRTPALDSLWLAGDLFRQLLLHVVAPLSPHRSTIVKFEHAPRFAAGVQADEEGADDELLWATSPPAAGDTAAEDIDPDRRSASLMQRVGRLARTLPEYQRIDPVWRTIRAMRIPGAGHGGYELYSWGKMTHRTDSFRSGRTWLRELVEIYERATRAIEEIAWIEAEPEPPDGRSVGLRGLPVVCRFLEPLTDAVFHGFVEAVFKRGETDFRLWGEPIWLGERKVHVYGLDLHLWQPLQMELTPRHFVFLLPAGTCGNTVHRLMTNLQRFVDPGVEMSVGGVNYGALIKAAILGREAPHV